MNDKFEIINKKLLLTLKKIRCMRFKLFILGMFAAAAMISCNNAVIIEDDSETFGLGESTSATFELNFKNTATYAGGGQLIASGYETAVYDAAVYIYKWNGANMTAEAMAYLPHTAFYPSNHLTLKVKNGQKKIFMALNIGNTGGSPLLFNNSYTFTNAASINKLDTGIQLNTGFDALNWIIRTATPNNFSTDGALPATTDSATWLIKTLAGGSITYASGSAYWKPFDTPIYGVPLMTNWDGPNDKDTLGSWIYTSDCEFTLLPDISAETSKTSAVGTNNHISIGVQRAFAKVSLRITADGLSTNNSNTWWGPYPSAVDDSDGSKGIFTPWTVNDSIVWSLGGINKRTYPFQVFRGTPPAVASPNYPLSTRDTIYRADPSATGSSALWYQNYDNLRVFPYNTYRNGATVSSVKANMLKVGNHQLLTAARGANVDLKFAFCTENGTEYPQLHDRGTYVVFGGVYTPRLVLTDLIKANVSDNDPYKGWNNAAAEVNVANKFGTSYTLPGNGYGAVGDLRDTLYYLPADRLFIFGTINLAKYYAWQLKLDKDNASPTITSSAIAPFISADRKAGKMFCYFQGQCFYRIWIKDAAAAKSSSIYDEFLVRRNHVYDINVVSIKGPGIGDPNEIIIPGKPLPELDTFVTADIKILNWHKVSQEVDISFD